MNDIESFSMNEGSKMPHSHSTPAGVDGGSRTPPTTPRKAGKMLAIRVQMLDDTITMFQIQAKALGKVLFDQVCKQLHLLEADYFGLEYQEPNGTKYWLDLEKPLCRQVGLSLIDPLLRFCVKFYTPDPAQLEEEFTRYLFCLQIKRDLAQGFLQCNDNTAALMASYIVQAECGDYVIEDYPDHTYLSTYKFVPHQDHELERRIMENHKKHAGQSPAEADVNLLETARRCELYGMKMHPAKDHEGESLNLAVAHMGIVVYQHYTKINTFSWAKIRKISFKRKRFLIKLHPEGYGYYKDTVEFFFDGRNECKNFWKKCVENHGFFRCTIVKRVVRQKTRVLSRGSSFRYSGKTQKQIVEFVRDNYVKRQTFHRSNSFRQTSSGRALQGLEGGGYRGATSSSSLMGSSSISAHPLLPLGDPALATPALSLSCGSMTLDSPTTATSASAGGTSHRRDDTVTSFRTLTSIDVHSSATPSQVQAQRQSHVTNQQRISSTGRISPSNSSPSDFPQPRPIPRHPWQRSASCRELYASSFEESGKARIKDADEAIHLPSQGELDNPVTRYNESNRSYSAASSKIPSLDHDFIPERVYSSSYPGTSSLSTESGHEESIPAGDLSHDDLSHDSYELLEREHECEYESYSSPHDDNDPMSDNSDEGIEQEMFQMDSETDSFVKLKSSKDKSHKKSHKYSDRRYSAKSEEEFVVKGSKIQQSSTLFERNLESRATELNKVILQDVSKKQDPVILQVQKQKMTMLDELKNFKPKHKISHVDSEVLREEGIMRPKSRIDDDMSPESNKLIMDTAERKRTDRAKSVASIEDQLPKQQINTGSLGRSKSREKSDSKKWLDKETRRHSREERKREFAREIRKTDRKSLEKYESCERSHSRDFYYGTKFSERVIDLRELRRSIERLDSSERDDYSGFGDFFTKEEKLGLRELRKSLEGLDSQSYKSNRRFDQHSFERLDSTESFKSEYKQKHSPTDKPKPPRRKSADRLDSKDKPYFNFDPRGIQFPDYYSRTYGRSDSGERRNEPSRNVREKKTSKKWDLQECKSYEYLDRSSEFRDESKIMFEESRKYLEKSRSEDKPAERDDWKSLNKARKLAERREKELQEKLSLESRTDSTTSEKKDYIVEPSFSEYTPKIVGSQVLGFEDAQSISHTIVERTKSDPNPPRQRLSSNNKRHMLMHQKSIDLTPADSGDEDAFSEGAAQKSNVDIPYTLHKRHVMNGTASDEKSESDSSKKNQNQTVDSGKELAKNLPKLPIKSIADIALDLSKIKAGGLVNKSSIDKPKGILVSPDKPKSILSPSDKPKSILSPTLKLSPTDNKSFVGQLSPTNKSPSKSPVTLNKSKILAEKISKVISMDKKLSSPETITIITTDKTALKNVPSDTNVMIVSALEKKRSPDSRSRSPASKSPSSKSPTSRSPNSRSPNSRSPNSRSPISKSPTNKGKTSLNFASVVEMGITQELEKRKNEKLTVPDDSLEKQDSIEKIPLPEIPMKMSDSPKLVLSPVRSALKTKGYEKPTIPEKTQRILDRIESKFTELNKNPNTRVSRPRVIDSRYDDFVDPVADLPLDDVPIKPALEFDSLKVPEMSFMFRPHTESFRSKSLSLAEEKAPIDTLLSPEVENKHFLDVSPKKTKKSKTECKKDFQKQSKSLEGDKPPLKKSGSKELRTSPSAKIDKSKLKLNEMPQEIIVIDSTESITIMPEVSIVQKGRSKSISRISLDKSFDETKQSKTKSASVDDEMIKSFSSSDKQRPKTLGISKSLSTSEKRDTSPKKKNASKMNKLESNRSSELNKFDPPLPPIPSKESKFKFSDLSQDLPLLDSCSSKQSELAQTVEQVVNERKEIKKALAGQEFVEPPVLRKHGQSPVLFARSRLGLSEGSGMVALQRQGATQSPTSQRRAKSLDAPVVSLHKLPPVNAFSSKDDTVDSNEPEDIVDPTSQITKQATSPTNKLNYDPINAPEAFTDSLSVTEPSAQYLESPLTENNDNVCPDLIPYEQEVKLKSSNAPAKEPKLSSIIKMFANATFIDQSSLESGTEDDGKVKTEASKTDTSSTRKDSKTDDEDRTPRIVKEVLKKIRAEKSEMPNVVVNVSEDYPLEEIDPNQLDIDMVKSPIQISIEECSDNDIELSNSQDEENTFHVEIDDKKDNSEDTLDSMDTQVQMQGIDSERSSPDYLGDKTDEKTLVEVELTPEYLEMKKDEYDTVENLPEDEPSTKPTTPEVPDSNLLNVDKKLRLSAERSKSDETNTYTPDRDDPDSSSCSIARSLGIGQIQTISDTHEIAQMKLARSFGSAEEESSSSAAPKLELTSTWRPFPLESSGSSSLEEGWIPQDESAQQIYSEHEADGNPECYQEDIADFQGSIGFPIGPEILASYGAFSLSRTLSRISERSTTSEQEKSELDDSFKPSSRSPSLDDESLISSDHQPSLSSDPPSGAAFPSVSEDRRTSSELPDIPIDVAGVDDGKSPKTRRSRLTLQSSEDWPSPPSSPIFDNTPIISHVETFYMDVRPEEATRVTVTDSTDTTTGRVGQDSDSDEENRTLHDDLHSNLLEEPSSASATIDGTVKIAVKPKSSSHSEDTSMGLSMSEWSSSTNTVRQFCQYSGTKSDDNSLTELGASISDWSGSTTVVPQQFITSTSKNLSDTPSDKSNVSLRALKSQTSIHLEEDEDKEKIEIEKPEFVEAEESETIYTSTFDPNQRFVEGEELEDYGFPDTPPPPRLIDDDDDEGDYDEVPDLPDLPEIPDLSRPIPEEDEDQYDNVPAMKYLSGNQVCMQVGRTETGEDMHEKYARLSVQSRSGDDDWSFEDRTPSKSEEGSSTLKSERPFSRSLRDQGTKSTERPVMVPIRMKSSSYYSTTSLSGESTTSSPPMPIRTQIRTKTMPYSSNKSPQSEGDTSSSMDSPAHTPDRGQRAFRRKRQQRRHRVVVDLEIKDGQIVSSTDSSFDVSTIPPPLLLEPSLDDVEGEDEECEMHEPPENREPPQY